MPGSTSDENFLLVGRSHMNVNEKCVTHADTELLLHHKRRCMSKTSVRMAAASERKRSHRGI